VRNGE